MRSYYYQILQMLSSIVLDDSEDCIDRLLGHDVAAVPDVARQQHAHHYLVSLAVLQGRLTLSCQCCGSHGEVEGKKYFNI